MAHRIPELLGVLGSILLIAGVFSPVLQPPHGPADQLSAVHVLDGNVVAGVGAVSFVLAWVFRWHRALAITAAAALAMLAVTSLKVHRLEGAAEAHLAWGCLLLGGGIVSLFVAAILAGASSVRRTKPFQRSNSRTKKNQTMGPPLEAATFRRQSLCLSGGPVK